MHPHQVIEEEADAIRQVSNKLGTASFDAPPSGPVDAEAVGIAFLVTAVRLRAIAARCEARGAAYLGL